MFYNKGEYILLNNYSQLSTLLGNIPNALDFSLKTLNSYGTGGNAKITIFPRNTSELLTAINAVKGKYNYVVLGNGSNVLISDKGFDGVVISTKNVNSITVKSNLLTADCGVKISSVIKEMSDNCFSGLEFLVGVPASVGGAITMNAGCYNKSIADAVKYVTTEVKTYTKSECEFAYRHSRFLKGETVIKACFLMENAEEDVIQEKLKTYKSFRRNPKGKTCGSVFRNDGFFAGKVIDEVGLKGYKINGAQISNEHANFIVANGGATSSDIYALIKTVKEKVYKEKQILLNEEVIYVGEF